jgi:CO dehydrogenase nickel-insertion accessory protein CooC1
VVINKLPPGLDPAPLLAGLEGLPLLGTFPLDPEIARADLEGRSPWTGSAAQRKALEKLLAAMAAPVAPAGRKRTKKT